MLGKLAINKWTVLVIIFMVTVGLGIYSPVFNGDFQFDDSSFIISNPAIRNLFDIPRIWKEAYPEPTRFVAFLTFALNFHLHQLDVFGYHLFNVLVHVIASLILWRFVLLLTRLEKVKQQYPQIDGSLIAFFTACLFLVHPIQTQAVSYISQRFASLATLFYLSSVFFYTKARVASSDKRIASYFSIAFVAALLGIFTKEIVATLPFAIVLVEICFFDGITALKKMSARVRGILILVWTSFLLIIPYFFFSDIVRMLTTNRLSRSHYGDENNALTYLLTQFRVIVTYLKLFVVPWGQNFAYDFPSSKSLFEVDTFLCFAVLSAIIFSALKLFKKNVLVSFGILWFFLSLGVESSLLPIRYVIFEHRCYLPSIGFFIAFNMIFYTFVKNKKAYIVLMSVIVLVFSGLTVLRNNIWKDEVVFWKDNVKKSPSQASTYINLAYALVAKGNLEEARRSVETAIKLEPDLAVAYSNLGLIYRNEGNALKAKELYKKALRLQEKSWSSHYNLGLLYKDEKNFIDAKKHFQRAKDLSAIVIWPIMKLADIYEEEGDTENALMNYREAFYRRPDSVDAAQSLLLFLSEKKMYKELRKISKDLMKFHNSASSLVRFGSIYADSQLTDIAVALLKKAVKRDIRYAGAYLEMGKIYGNYEEFDKAINVWLIGLKYNPEDNRFVDLIQRAEELKKGASF